MFNVRLAGGHLYGKQLFTWLSLVVSLMASFVLSFFPLDVLDEIWDLIESVSEGFLTYSSVTFLTINYYHIRKTYITCKTNGCVSKSIQLSPSRICLNLKRQSLLNSFGQSSASFHKPSNFVKVPLLFACDTTQFLQHFL